MLLQYVSSEGLVKCTVFNIQQQLVGFNCTGCQAALNENK